MILNLCLLFTAVIVHNVAATLTTDNVKYIEATLANISSKLTDLDSDRDIRHSLTSVTSLLQLSLMKGLLADSSDSDSPDLTGQEAYTLLKRIEESVNASITNQHTMMARGSDNQQAIADLQEQLSAMFSTLNGIKKDVKTILRHTLTATDDSQDEHTVTTLPHSCQEIKSSTPDSPSGYYTIVDSDGHTRHIYCHMGELCGSSEGWTRVAYLDMSDPEEKCPNGFKLYEVNGVKACGKHSGGCVSTTFPSSEGISYSEVCGKVIGYQFGSPDGSKTNSIDGISLTHGSPRTHIWSFISGYYESTRSSKCPCGTSGSIAAPSFIGHHYFCEAAAVPNWQSKLYTDDPLWDGKGCGSIEVPCCNLPGLPWFHRSFSYTTTDYIEMRLCCNEGVNNEDVPVSYYEIYVK